jgi:hypothetical protein
VARTAEHHFRPESSGLSFRVWRAGGGSFFPINLGAFTSEGLDGFSVGGFEVIGLDDCRRFGRLGSSSRMCWAAFLQRLTKSRSTIPRSLASFRELPLGGRAGMYRVVVMRAPVIGGAPNDGA